MNLAILFANRKQRDQMAETPGIDTVIGISMKAHQSILEEEIRRDEYKAAAALDPHIKGWHDTLTSVIDKVKRASQRLEESGQAASSQDIIDLHKALDFATDAQSKMASLCAHSIPLAVAARDLVSSGIVNPPASYPSPTPEQLDSTEFKELWSVMKDWDINVPGWYEGYTGCMGNHVMAVLNALPVLKEDESGHEYKVPASMAAEFDRIMEGINGTKSYSEEWNAYCDELNETFGDYRV
ncbi:hypothetical protein FAES_3252 [Fibrella aestuarina BUZ 2]|uniref:Uncharacterized protein n=1 Tax=Fibrella aestuarina BUZ 2 TaxID=1166018 RepID=I0KAV8_9BACT|nr:hypothetical protein [Fibrella aestuarina]CCH01261.1 hypothetical protein FAES_3252 [Fibrella aestuarina BUZ 2]